MPRKQLMMQNKHFGVKIKIFCKTFLVYYDISYKIIVSTLTLYREFQNVLIIEYDDEEDNADDKENTNNTSVGFYSFDIL